MAKILKRLRSGGKENLKARLEDLENKLRTQDEWYIRLEKKNKELFEENMILKREKDELLRRLNRLASDQMSRGNPGIADISDHNRPTKLGEKWSSLYTEEWMDAYEELRHDAQRNQPRTIEKQLLDIISLCYKKCHEIADDQMQKAKFSLNGFEHYIVDDSLADRNRSQMSPTLSKTTKISRVGEIFIEEVINNYKGRRKHDTDWIQSVQRRLVNMISQRGIQLPKVLQFTKKCTELCWFMCIQDPPLVIEYENLEGKPVDRSKFNLYDRNGTVAEYVVWPALLLHKNGPVLAKGTIQPVQKSVHLPVIKQTPKSPTTPENRIRVISKTVRGASPTRDYEPRVHSSRFPDKHYSSMRFDRISKSSGNAREPQRQGIIYYNEKANMLNMLNDRITAGSQGQHPFSYNLSVAKEVTIHQSPRPRLTNFDEHMIIGRNKTSVTLQHSRKQDIPKALYGPQRIIIANQTAV